MYIKLTVFVLAICVFFIISGVTGAVHWASDVLRDIPAPTQEWAEIIGHLAWPATIAWLVVRFRHSLRRLIEILIIRFNRDDIGIANILTVTRNSTVVPLDPGGGSGASDGAITEALLEYISDNANLPTVSEWLNNSGRGALSIREFITQPEYANLRLEAYRALIEGGANG